jgi:hypothetical protein
MKKVNKKFGKKIELGHSKVCPKVEMREKNL